MPRRVTVMEETPTPVDGTDVDGKEDRFWLKDGEQKDFDEITNEEQLENKRVRIDNINDKASGKSDSDSDSDDDEDES